MSRTCIAFAAAVALAGTGHAQAQDAPQQADDLFNIPADVSILGPNETKRRATAIVNGAIITGTDVDQRVALAVAASGVGRVPEEELQRLRLQILRTLIDETLQIQEAQAQEIEIPEERVNEAYARIATDRFGRSVEAMDAWLREIGSSPASLKRQIRGEFAWDLLLRRNVAPFVNVSESEVNEMYQRLMASKGEYEYRIGEIFLQATPATREAVLANARQIFEDLRNGASFPDYARRFSDATTRSVGGDLGWIKLNQLKNPQLEAVAQQMQPDQMVGPVEIPGGFSILYLIDRRQIGMADPRDAALSLKQIGIDFAPGTTPEAARARAEAFATGVQQIQGCGDADRVAPQLGAEVVNNDQIRVRDLPEALQRIVLDLSVGEATPPFGSLDEGVRVLLLCGRDDPPSDSGPSPEQLMAQLEDDRVQKRAQRYLRDLRRDAVIEYN